MAILINKYLQIIKCNINIIYDKLILNLNTFDIELNLEFLKCLQDNKIDVSLIPTQTLEKINDALGGSEKSKSFFGVSISAVPCLRRGLTLD